MDKTLLPLLDDFYDDEPYLTAEKTFDSKHQIYIDIIKKYDIKTAVITWLPEEELADITSECELVFKDHYRKGFVWDKKVLFLTLTIGAPIAVCTMEYLRAYGIKNIVAYGTAGSIISNFDTSKAIVVERAIRDEGTSFHYVKPSMYIDLDKEFATKLANFFADKSVAYEVGTTWTCDAFFRETRGRIAKRISQGAIAVEMECSALTSVAQFYGDINFCQFLFFSDAVSSNNWSMVDTKEKRRDTKHRFTRLALSFAETL